MRLEEKKIAKDLIGENKIEEAITFLNSKLSGKSKDELILISSRFEENLQQNRIGVLSSEQLSISQNQIRSSLIELLNGNEAKNLFPSNNSKTEQNRNKVWLIIGGVITMIIILAIIFSQKEVTGIKGDDNDNNNIEIHN